MQRLTNRDEMFAVDSIIFRFTRMIMHIILPVSNHMFQIFCSNARHGAFAALFQDSTEINSCANHCVN